MHFSCVSYVFSFFVLMKHGIKSNTKVGPVYFVQYEQLYNNNNCAVLGVYHNNCTIITKAVHFVKFIVWILSLTFFLI